MLAFINTKFIHVIPYWLTMMFFLIYVLFLKKKEGNKGMVERTYRAHVRNFDLEVPLLPHPLLVRSGVTLLHCLLTWRNSSVEPQTHTHNNVTVSRGQTFNTKLCIVLSVFLRLLQQYLLSWLFGGASGTFAIWFGFTQHTIKTN